MYYSMRNSTLNLNRIVTTSFDIGNKKHKIYKEEMQSTMEVIIKFTGYLKVCPDSSSEKCVLWCLENWDMGHHGLPEDITQFTGITIL